MSVPPDRDGGGPPVLGNGDRPELHERPGGGAPGAANAGGTVITPRAIPTPEERSEWARRSAATRRANAAAGTESDQTRRKRARKEERAEGAALGSDPVNIRVDHAQRSKVPADKSGLDDPAGYLSSDAAGQAMAKLIRDSLIGILGMLLGVDARMNPLEESMILPPAGRIIARMSPEDMAKYSALMDPISLLGGCAIWGARVYSIKRYADGQKRDRAEAAARAAQVERAARTPESSAPVRTETDPGAVVLNGVIRTNANGVAAPDSGISSLLDAS